MSERILIVDDDPVQRRLLDNMLRKFGYEPVVAEGGAAAVEMLLGSGAIDAVVLDLVMPDLDGLAVLAKIREAGLPIPVLVQTAHGGIDTVITAIRAGATDFVVKPVGAERLQVSLRNALTASALEGELARIKRSRSGALSFRNIITRSPNMRTVLHTAERAAASSIPVAEGDVVGVAEFPQLARPAAAFPVATGSTPHSPPLPLGLAEESFAGNRIDGEAPPVAPTAPTVPATAALVLLDVNGDVRTLQDIEADTIRFAITYYRGQMSEVARRLRIGRSTLYRKLDSLRLAQRPDVEIACVVMG